MPDQDPPDKVSKFYQNLLSDGYTEKNLGSEDDFRSALSDPTKSAKIYNNLLSDGYTVKNLGGMDQFLSTFNKSNAVSQRPSSYPIKEGFSAKINMGEPLKPLPINLHPDQPQVQQEKQVEPSIENNFGFNHNQLAAGQQPTQDNTTNVAPQQSLNKVDFDVNHEARVKEREDFTNRAIDDATQRSLQIKGIKAQPGSVQYNQQRNEFLKQVQNGDASPIVKDGEVGLSRTTGFWENLKKGWNDATTASDEADDFANNMTAAERVEYLNKKQSEQAPSPYIGERPNLMGSAAHFTSSSIPFLAKAGAGAVIGAGAVAAAPESMGASLAGLPTAMSFMLTASDMANQGVQSEVTRRFQILKKEHPERSDVENMEEAGKGALVGGVGGILENAALMGTGMKNPITADSKSVIGQTIDHMINSGVHLGTVSGGITAAEQEIGNLQGIKTSQSDILKNSLESFKEGATTGALLTGMMHAPKILKSAFKYGLVKSEDPQTIANTLQANENAGNIPEGTTQKITADLNGYKEALNKIPDGLSPESQASIAGLIQKKNNLIEEAKTKDYSFKDFYDTQIKSIDGQISDIQRTGKPFEHEIDEATGKPYEQPTYDDVAQQRVRDLADKISKGKKLEPEDLQTQQIFPKELESELGKIKAEETKSNEGKENPNTEVVDNVNKFLLDNEQKPVEPNTDKVSRETKEPTEPVSSPVISEPKAKDVVASKVEGKDESMHPLLKDEKGNPITVYHGTTADVSKGFEPLDYGSHGKHEYYYFAKDKNWVKKFGKEDVIVNRDKFKIGSYHLDIKNPLDIRDKAFTAKDWINYFSENGVKLSKETSADFERRAESNPRREIGGWQLFRHDNGLFRDDLMKSGYDGLVISDMARGKADNTVYVALNKDQIRPASSKPTNTEETKPIVNKEQTAEENLPVEKENVDLPNNNKNETTPKEQIATGETGRSSEETGNSTPKIKVLKKRAKPTIKSPLYLKALSNESEDPHSQVLKYFIGGGKISRDALIEFHGDNKGELNSKISLQVSKEKDPKAPTTIDGFAHQLWDNSPEHVQEMYDTMDFREAIEDVLGSHNSRTSMAEELVKKTPLDDYEKTEQEWYDKHYGDLKDVPEETFDEAIDMLEGMSDKDIQKIIDTEQEALNDSDFLKTAYSEYQPKSNEVKETEKLLNNAQEEVRVAKESLASKKKELYKSLIDDQQDLFGERKSEQKPQLFNERADQKELDKALTPFRERVTKAEQEVERLNKVLEDYQNKPTAQLEIKLNKAEESLAKRKITSAGADKILKEGMTKETLEANKEVFDGGIFKKEDLQKAKIYLDETGRRTNEPTENRQENTGNDGNKELSDKGESVPRTETKDATGESNAGTAAEEPPVATNKESLGKVAFARSNSYDSYKLLHPNESVEDYNKVRSSDVEIPTGDLRKLSKEYAKNNQNKESYSTEKFYNEIAGSKPTKTGRIPVSPIIGEAKDLSKILLDVSNSLNQKISFLKAGRIRALGSYSPGNAGIKIKFNGDLDVTAHEIGHSIDDNFGILKDLVKTPDKEVEKELSKFSPFGSKPPKGSPDARKYRLGEGFAEWLRAYIVNPEEAIKQAPKIYDLYKSKVSEDYQKSLTDFSNDVRTWAGSTGRDMVLSNIEWEPEKAKGLIKELFSKKDNDMFAISFADKLAANFVNPMRAFEKAFNYARGIKGLDEVLPENDPTILARLFLSIDRKFGEFLEGGLRDSKDQLTSETPRTFKWLIEPLDNTDMATIKREMQDVTAYMVAERTVELGNRFKREEILTGIGGGIYKDVNVAKKALEEFSNDPEKLERIQEAAKRYREFADDNLKYMVDKGRLSKESYDEIKKNNLQYVALHRIMEAEPGTEIQVFKGSSKNISSVSQPVQSIRGSTKKISNPYSSLLDSMYRSIKESDRNEVMKSFRDMLVNNRGMYEGDPKKLSEIGVLAKSGDKNAITIFVDGKPEKWVFQKDVYEALKGLDKEAFKLPGFVTFPARILRSMTTKFPTFALRNWVRDLQDRLIKSNDHSGIKDLFGNKEHWQDVARKGGLNAGYYVRDKAHYYGLMEQAMDELSKNQKTIFADPIKINKLWHGYESGLQASETSNRVAEYRAAFRQAKKKGMDDYNAGLYGAFKSRDLMDFAVAGHYMKIINQIIPFSNAAVQALRSDTIRFKQNPSGFLFRTLLFSILPQAALWWWNHKDDETAKQYEQLPFYQRDLFYNLKIGDNKWLSLPKPYELGMIGSGTDRALSYYLYNNKNAFEGYAGDAFKSISPIDESVIGGPYQPIIGAISNYDMFRGKHIISPEEEGLNLSLRHTETASWLSQRIQKAAGIDGRKLDYIIRSQFSYVGNEGLKLTDKIAELTSDHKAENQNKFDITDTGLFKRSPAYNAPVVQKMMEFAREWRLDRSREYKEFKSLAAKYFDTEDNSEKEKYSQQMIHLAQNLLDTWKSQGVEEKVQEKEINKRLKNKK